MITIRMATPDDAADLLAIYKPYVEQTSITFELETPTVDEFCRRISDISEKYPYLVAVNEHKDIIGYCYASSLRSRAAYNHCVETSIYIHQGQHRNGVGTLLYEELEIRLRKMGIKNLYANITWRNEPCAYVTHQSPVFHEKMGYTKVGQFHRCGYKFGEWFDIIWMEKFLDS